MAFPPAPPAGTNRTGIPTSSGRTRQSRSARARTHAGQDGSVRTTRATGSPAGRTRASAPDSGETFAFYRLRAPDWVNIIPLTRDDEVVMVRQYRHGSDVVTLEIPGGIVDPGEEPAAAAARELLEETGYAGEEPVHIGIVDPKGQLV